MPVSFTRHLLTFAAFLAAGVCVQGAGIGSNLQSTQSPSSAELSSVAELQAKLAALQSELAAQKRHSLELEARNAALEAAQASQNKAIALAVGDDTSSKGPHVAPSSSLNWDRALKAATAARYLVPGSKLMTVMPTGSMKPMFDERAVLIMEPASFSELAVGDIVTFIHPKHKVPVVHRIVEKRGNRFWSKGDNNGRRDDVYITAENYQARVCGVIYSKEAAKR